MSSDVVRRRPSEGAKPVNLWSNISLFVSFLTAAAGTRVVWRTRDWRLAFIPLILGLLVLDRLQFLRGDARPQTLEIAALTFVVVASFYFLFRRGLRQRGGLVLRVALALVLLYQIASLWLGLSVKSALAYPEFSLDILLLLSVTLLDRILEERKGAERRLRDDALRDSLTGLPNRIFFMEELRLSHRRAKQRLTYDFAVLLVDLDRFKLLNDSLGHAAGDVFLVQTARRLRSSLRPEDTVARVGGDEFAILLNNVKDEIQAKAIAERILELLAVPHALDKAGLFTTASIGISLSMAGYNRPEDLLRDADTAMYQAKAAGQSRYKVFGPKMYKFKDSKVQLELEQDLRNAIERGELLLYFQPVLAVESAEITGCEALVRWKHPKRGLVCPADFIPMAEETGLILPIGEWVLRTACAQATDWRRAGLPTLRMSVNVSPRQLFHDAFATHLFQILRETDTHAGCLQLELTESMILPDLEPVCRQIEQLAEFGVRIAVDDFGVGYSSASYLRRLRIHALKIDRSFFDGLRKGDPSSAEFVRALVTIAKGLNLTVTAEGIESEDQWEFLRSLSCDEMQGFLFSRPLPAETFEERLREARGAFAAHALRSEGRGRREPRPIRPLGETI